jgi:hypothetical protein
VIVRPVVGATLSRIVTALTHFIWPTSRRRHTGSRANGRQRPGVSNGPAWLARTNVGLLYARALHSCAGVDILTQLDRSADRFSKSRRRSAISHYHLGIYMNSAYLEEVPAHPSSGTEDDDDDRDDEHADENEARIREVDDQAEAPEEFEVDDEDELGHPEDDDADDDMDEK